MFLCRLSIRHLKHLNFLVIRVETIAAWPKMLQYFPNIWLPCFYCLPWIQFLTSSQYLDDKYRTHDYKCSNWRQSVFFRWTLPIISWEILLHSFRKVFNSPKICAKLTTQLMSCSPEFQIFCQFWILYWQLSLRSVKECQILYTSSVI